MRPSAASSRMRVRTQWMPSGSRPFTGSSKMSTAGSPSSAEAMPSRWPMPSDKPFARRLATLCRPTTAEHLVHPAAGDAVAAGQAQQVVAGPAAAVQRLGVEQGAHLAHRCRQVAVAAPAYGYRALRRRVEAQDHPHGGGLPGTVRAEETGDHARPDGERQVVDGHGGAVALDQAVGFDHRSTTNGPATSDRPRHGRGGGRRCTWIGSSPGGPRLGRRPGCLCVCV